MYMYILWRNPRLLYDMSTQGFDTGYGSSKMLYGI